MNEGHQWQNLQECDHLKNFVIEAVTIDTHIVPIS